MRAQVCPLEFADLVAEKSKGDRVALSRRRRKLCGEGITNPSIGVRVSGAGP